MSILKSSTLRQYLLTHHGTGPGQGSQVVPEDRRAHHRQHRVQAPLQSHRRHPRRLQSGGRGQAVLRRPHQLPDQLGGLQQGPRRLLLVRDTHVDIISRWQSRRHDISSGSTPLSMSGMSTK